MSQNPDGILPTPDAWDQVSEAVRDHQQSGADESGGRGRWSGRRGGGLTIFAKITAAGSSDGYYTAKEVTWNESNGEWQDVSDGRQWGGGNLPELRERNLIPGLEPTEADESAVVLVTKKPTNDDPSQVDWTFRAQTNAYLLTDCENGQNQLLVKGPLKDHVNKVVVLSRDSETCWKVERAVCLCDLETVQVADSFDDCAACKKTCHTLTCQASDCTDSGTTKKIKARGMAEHVGAIVTIGGDWRCWSVGAEKTCDGHEDIGDGYTVETDCTSCTGSRNFYSLSNCDGSPDSGKSSIKAWDTRDTPLNVGDVLKEKVEDGSGNCVWECWEVTNVESFPGCSDTSAVGNDITDRDTFASCADCLIEFYAAENCDDPTDTLNVRGEGFEVGKVYTIEGDSRCLKITSQLESEPGTYKNACPSDPFDDCEGCGRKCYELTNCISGDTSNVYGDLSAVGTSHIKQGTSCLSFERIDCTGSESEIGAYEPLEECNECGPDEEPVEFVTGVETTAECNDDGTLTVTTTETTKKGCMKKRQCE